MQMIFYNLISTHRTHFKKFQQCPTSVAMVAAKCIFGVAHLVTCRKDVTWREIIF